MTMTTFCPVFYLAQKIKQFVHLLRADLDKSSLICFGAKGFIIDNVLVASPLCKLNDYSALAGLIGH